MATSKFLNLDTDTTLSANSDSIVPSQKAIKTYVDNKTPTVNDATLTIQKNGSNVATFTANSSTNTTANITVPTDLSNLTNNSGFIKNNDILLDYDPHSTANPRAIFQQKLDDCFYRANLRHTISATGTYSGNFANLFDFNPDSHFDIAKGNTVVLTMEAGSYNFDISYPDTGAYIYLVFYYRAGPKDLSAISCRVCETYSNYPNETWHTLTGQVVAQSGFEGVNCINTIRFPNVYYGLKTIEITLDNTAGTASHDGGGEVLWLNEISFFGGRTKVNNLPVLTKLGGDTIYGNLTIPTEHGSFVGNLTGTANKAIYDVDGNPIKTTYLKAADAPVVNNATLTITQGGVTKGTFTANASSNTTIALDAGSSSISIDNKSITSNTSNEIQTVGVIDQRNTSTAIKTWTGTKAQYDAIQSKDSNTLYNVTDDSDVTLTVLAAMYPVGSIYITTNASCPLGLLIPGSSWELVGSGKVLQGADNDHAAGTTIAAGLPNITATETFGDRRVNFGTSTATGAFYHTTGGGSQNYTQTVNVYTDQALGFDASLSNSIYGNSDTVQPPAYVVNIYRRVA